MLASQRPHDFFELKGRVQILLFVSTGRIVTLFHVKKSSRFLQMKVSSCVCVCVCVCVCMCVYVWRENNEASNMSGKVSNERARDSCAWQ